MFQWLIKLFKPTKTGEKVFHKKKWGFFVRLSRNIPIFTARFDADNLNKLKNMVSKVIGEKMKVRKLGLHCTW